MSEILVIDRSTTRAVFLQQVLGKEFKIDPIGGRQFSKSFLEMILKTHDYSLVIAGVGNNSIQRGSRDDYQDDLPVLEILSAENRNYKLIYISSVAYPNLLKDFPADCHILRPESHADYHTKELRTQVYEFLSAQVPTFLR